MLGCATIHHGHHSPPQKKKLQPHHHMHREVRSMMRAHLSPWFGKRSAMGWRTPLVQLAMDPIDPGGRSAAVLTLLV